MKFIILDKHQLIVVSYSTIHKRIASSCNRIPHDRRLNNIVAKNTNYRLYIRIIIT